jgi:hypothetical protein
MMESSGTLQAAIGKLATAKAEHRAILQQIAGDAGMSPETRTALVEHLCTEEDEHVRRIAALAAGADVPAAGGAASRLTVGSLRVEPPVGPRLGSLRTSSVEGDRA